jgi:hypothetical protein
VWEPRLDRLGARLGSFTLSVLEVSVGFPGSREFSIHMRELLPEVVVVAGPTGSGRSTVVAGLLSALAASFLIRRAQLARLEVDVVEDLSVVVSGQDGKPVVNALCDKALRFLLA